jgi:predicted RNase H-like nuclease (RuvC/YqgF family)
MDTESLVKLIKEGNEETRRHFDVVAEGLKSEIRVIAEGHGVLVEKIDRLDTRMDHLETKVDRLDTRMDHLETKLDGFIVETRTNFEEVRASIKFSYAELDRRLTFLEAGFKDLSSRLASLENRQSP